MIYLGAGVAGFVLGTALIFALDWWFDLEPFDDWQHDEHSV